MKLSFHHIGVACHDLDSESVKLEPLGYHSEGEDFADPLQRVAGRFLVGGGPRLELLRPTSDASPLASWLKGGVKLYHLAYETESLGEAIQHLQGQRAKVVVPPVCAVAFAGRRIAFMLLSNMLLTELIETA